MEIIPVIDLLNGIVVHAKRGQRSAYQALKSSLTESCEPSAVLAAYLRVYPFRTIYLADLNAIMGKASQADLIAELLGAFPQLEFWVDSGNCDTTNPWLTVIGTESITPSNWASLQELGHEWVLSLDFLNGDIKGYAPALVQVEHWPQRVIVMDLDQVGSLQGPDRNRLSRLQRVAPNKNIYAAGGIRDGADLAALKALGIQGALIASALHAGTVTAAHF